ncbi:hypothetical protein ACO2Q3_07260 [Caulobacter sp. KR2-114]|uniref:hypothetical protein n=1 Tax=Caulobacter sp. KR2-114 TaxID=3400912 RepID=UPI003BFF180C
MRIVLGLMLAMLATTPALAARGRPAHAAGVTKGVANAALAAAARTTPVAAIDYDLKRCDPRTVEQWLKALVGANARSIAWSGGPCTVVGPGIDSGSDWCADAVITLAHPKNRSDRPMIEVFFEAPKAGRPGAAYAFRGVMQAADGEDVSRFRDGFEADWTSRFPAPEGAIVDCAEGQ